MTQPIYSFDKRAAQPRTTFWLYDATRILTAIKLPTYSSDETVRHHALQQARACPRISLNHHETPFEFQRKLRRAIVKAKSK